MAQNQIRQLLWKNGMPAVQLAELLGMKAPAFRRYVRGEADPKFGLAQRIADELGCTVDEVMGAKSVPYLEKDIKASPEPEVDLIPVYTGRYNKYDLLNPFERRERPNWVTAYEAYAINICDDSMSPRFEPGELALVEVGRPVLKGDYVLVCRRAPGTNTPQREECLLQRYVGEDITHGAGIELHMFEYTNGDDINSFRPEEVVFMHKITGVIFR
jgi:transcriptional regulator with XRE-family HTH domain